MKRFLLLLALASVGTAGMAQVSRGGLFLFGSGNIGTNNKEVENNYHDDYPYPKEFHARLSLGGGYFLSNRVAAGLSLSASGRKTHFTETEKSVRKNFGASLFARYYVPVAGQFFFYTHTGLSYSDGGFTFYDENGSHIGPQITTVGVAMKPGFSYFFNPHFGLDLQVGRLAWESRKTVVTAPDNRTVHREGTFDLGFDLTTIQLGLVYFLLK